MMGLGSNEESKDEPAFEPIHETASSQDSSGGSDILGDLDLGLGANEIDNEKGLMKLPKDVPMFRGFHVCQYLDRLFVAKFR